VAVAAVAAGVGAVAEAAVLPAGYPLWGGDNKAVNTDCSCCGTTVTSQEHYTGSNIKLAPKISIFWHLYFSYTSLIYELTRCIYISMYPSFRFSQLPPSRIHFFRPRKRH
jgi:hypothetical protein